MGYRFSSIKPDSDCIVTDNIVGTTSPMHSVTARTMGIGFGLIELPWNRPRQLTLSGSAQVVSVRAHAALIFVAGHGHDLMEGMASLV